MLGKSEKERFSNLVLNLRDQTRPYGVFGGPDGKTPFERLWPVHAAGRLVRNHLWRKAQDAS